MSSACMDQGTLNQQTSNVIEHANSNQHKAAMTYLKAALAKANNEPAASFSPNAHSLINMDATTKERMKCKFDICYVMAKEGIMFSKYPALYDLKSRHDMDLGAAYKNDISAKFFIHHITQSQCDLFVQSTSANSHYFSFLMDGTTDSGKVEDKLVAILYCKRDDTVEEVRTCARYLSVVTPNKTDINGLIDCLKEALKRLKIDFLDRDAALFSLPVLTGGGTDGVSINVGQHNSMRAKQQDALPWLFWAWCYAHRLELASKNGLRSSLFKEIEELLLRLYYLYEKSLKKTHELASIVEDFKEAFDFPGSGMFPYDLKFLAG